MVMHAVPATTVDGHDEGAPVPPPPEPRRRWPDRLTIMVLVVGILATAALCTLSRLNYVHNERRQVSVQAQLAAAALAVTPVEVQRLLGRPATSVAASGDVHLFDDGMISQVGPAPKAFVSARLFRMVGGVPHLVDSLGAATQLDMTSPEATALLTKAASTGRLTATRTATDTIQRIDYAFAASALGRTYVAYAEEALPGNRHLDLDAASPLSGMIFALYFGRAETSGALIETNASKLPLEASAAHVTIPLGDQVLTAAMTPRTPLLGTFAAWVAWIVAGAGLLLTAVMALLTERLARRRAVAEQLVTVTEELYRTQRGLAETLQTALLPKHLAQSAGLAVATRYVAGTEGIDVGGDWYDLVELPGDRTFFTIGDVSGRGLSAATMMSRLRHSITAYATEGNPPAVVLAKVSGLIDLVRDEHFATALCGILDLRTGVVTVANAGHPPLVLISGGTATTVPTRVGPPLGVGTCYQTDETTLTSGDVLLAYTDGLVERRDESIDAGLERLCHVARPAAELEDLLDTVLAALVPQGAPQDDAAILGLKWTPESRRPEQP